MKDFIEKNKSSFILNENLMQKLLCSGFSLARMSVWDQHKYALSADEYI